MTMILKGNRGQIVCKDLKYCESFIDRCFGLLIPGNSRNLLFKTRFGIHTLLLKESIDILILDPHHKIVKIKKDLKPNRFFFWHPVYYLVLELPSGTIKKFNLKEGQLVVIK